VLNQGIVWNPQTGAADRYTKWHPVPFGEYIPMRSVFMRYNFFDRLREVSRDMLSGTRTEPLDIAGVKVADAICFDIAYDDGLTAQLRTGAQLLVVQSSQATFIHTDQTDQQFAITRLRAMETGRWVAVATTNGVSGLIAPTARHRHRRQAHPAVLEAGSADQPADPGDPDRAVDGPASRRADHLGVLLVLLPYRRGARRTRPGEPEVRELETVTHGRVMTESPRSAASSWSSRPTTRPTTSPGSSAGCAPPSPSSTCSSSTTTHPTAPAHRPTSWPPPTRRSTCCTGRQGRARGGVPGRVRLGLDAGYDVIGRWTPTAPTSPSSCTGCSRRCSTPTW
jgi:hypothetical protein